MYKTLVIFNSQNNMIDTKIIEDIDYIIIKELQLKSDYQVIVNNEVIDFDYLLVDERITMKLMTEDGYIITNQFFETSIDNYFAIGNKVKSDIDINKQLNIIIDYIKGNY